MPARLLDSVHELAMCTLCVRWQVYTREAENTFERTTQPLSAAVQCLDKHHGRDDYDQLRLDEVEDTLCEVRDSVMSWWWW